MAKTPLFSALNRIVQHMLPRFWQQSGESEASATGFDPERRAFLKTAALLSVAPLGWSFGNQQPGRSIPISQSPTNHSNSPVLITGAGLAGLVTAYRLTQQGIPCELYEASHRLGGRMWTRPQFTQDGMFVELGGELVDTNHQAIQALCQELKIPLHRFEAPSADMADALFYSEDALRTKAEVIQAFQPLARAIATDLQQLFPDGVVQVPTYANWGKNPSHTAWLDQLSLDDYLARQPETPSWLVKLIQAAYTGEYGLDTHEQSALNLLLLIGTETSEGFRLFGESDEAMRIAGGSSTLPQALYESIRHQVPIHWGHALQAIEEQGDQLALHYIAGHQRVTRKTGQAVLAIPFTQVRGLQNLSALGLSAPKRRAIQEWGYGTNSKQMLAFHTPFWRHASPASTGELFTDWATQCYWETSRLQPGGSGILTNFVGGKAGAQATASQWKLALADLQQLYPLAARQGFTGKTAGMNWARYPWAQGSYTCPKPGQYTTFMGAAGEPELQSKLFFAGEHCSVNWAGFMNGAVESGIQAAGQILQARSETAQQPESVELASLVEAR